MAFKRSLTCWAVLLMLVIVLVAGGCEKTMSDKDFVKIRQEMKAELSANALQILNKPDIVIPLKERACQKYGYTLEDYKKKLAQMEAASAAQTGTTPPTHN